MAMKKITFEIEFERTDDTSKRFPTTQCVRTVFSALAQFECDLLYRKKGNFSKRCNR